MHYFYSAHYLCACGGRRVVLAPRLEWQDKTRFALPRTEIHVTKPFSTKDALNPALDVLNQFAAKLDSVIKNSPLSEIEKNARQHFFSQLSRHGLVTREEYEVQVALLEKARTKLVELETKITLLEAERPR